MLDGSYKFFNIKDNLDYSWFSLMNLFIVELFFLMIDCSIWISGNFKS